MSKSFIKTGLMLLSFVAVVFLLQYLAFALIKSAFLGYLAKNSAVESSKVSDITKTRLPDSYQHTSILVVRNLGDENGNSYLLTNRGLVIIINNTTGAVTFSDTIDISKKYGQITAVYLPENPVHQVGQEASFLEETIGNCGAFGACSEKFTLFRNKQKIYEFSVNAADQSLGYFSHRFYYLDVANPNDIFVGAIDLQGK